MHDAQSRKYPDASGTSERRLSPRFPVKPVEYVEVGDTNGGIILDISQAGMAVSTAQSLGSNRTWKFRFQLPRSPETIEALAEISWLGETKKRAGVRFVDLPPAARGQIVEWIRQQSGDTADGADPAAATEREATVASAELPMAESSVLDEVPEVTADPQPGTNGGRISKIAFSSPLFVPQPSAKEIENEDETEEIEEIVPAWQGQVAAPRESRGERRAQPRKMPNSALYLRLDDGNAGLIENLSETGMSFRAAKALQRDVLVVTFQIPGTDKSIETPVAIVWTSASKKKVGARFTALPEEEKYRIAGWVDSKLLATRNPVTRPEKTPAVRGAYRAGLALVPDALPEEIARRNRDARPVQPPAASPAAAAVNMETRSPIARTSVTAPPAPEQPPPVAAPSGQQPAPPVARAPFETILIPLDEHQELPGAPERATIGFWKMAAAAILLGVVCFVCFKAGMQYSRKGRPSLPESVVANRTEQVSERPPDATKPATSESPVGGALSEPPEPTSTAARDKAQGESSDSSSLTTGSPASQTQNSITVNSSVSNSPSKPANLATSGSANRSSPSHADVPLERTAARDSGDRLKSTPSTVAAGSHLAVPTGSSKSAEPAFSTPETKQPDPEVKTVTQPVAQQTVPASSAPVFNDLAAKTPPASSAPAVNTSAAAEPVQAPAGTVTFFSRFRSIRNAEGSAAGSEGGVLQIGPLLTSPLPTYPIEARRKQVQGIVELLATVGANGSVESVQFIRGPADLADVALDAARQWHYGSTALGGRPVTSEQSIYFTFKLAK